MSNKYTISLPVFDNCLSANGVCEITHDSEQDKKDALEKFARYFKNEMHFDNIQYEANRHDRNCIGFLFVENAMDIMTDDHTSMPSRCIGGCVFIKKGENWVLCWVWLHPYFRNKRILSRQWKIFYSKFGDFYIEAPISFSMQAFLSKQNSLHSLVKI